MNIEIIHKDEFIVAINKPHGLLVHRSSIAADVTEFALQKVRDLLGQQVFLVHRIDRKTSGVLLFALSSEVNGILGKEFRDRRVGKRYSAIVRGWLPEDQFTVDYALINDKGKLQEAITRFKTIQRVEIDVPLGRHQTSRYSLVEAFPETGRMHQIRKHLSHLRHPIIGDRPHGCSKQNRMWKQQFNMLDMMLHAEELNFMHPDTKKEIILKAEKSQELKRVMKILGL